MFNSTAFKIIEFVGYALVWTGWILAHTLLYIMLWPLFLLREVIRWAILD